MQMQNLKKYKINSYFFLMIFFIYINGLKTINLIIFILLNITLKFLINLMLKYNLLILILFQNFNIL